jgi:hypothetical protein
MSLSMFWSVLFLSGHFIGGSWELRITVCVCWLGLQGKGAVCQTSGLSSPLACAPPPPRHVITKLKGSTESHFCTPWFPPSRRVPLAEKISKGFNAVATRGRRSRPLWGAECFPPHSKQNRHRRLGERSKCPLFPSSVCIFVVQAHGLSSPVRDSWESTMSSSLVKKSQHIWNNDDYHRDRINTVLVVNMLQNFLAFNTFIQWPEKWKGEWTRCMCFGLWE